jgi:hypothetical protein
VCRNINKIDKFSTHFKKLNLTYVERLKGFYPNGIFREHLLGVGFNTSFIHTCLTQDRNNVNNNPTSINCDVERLQSATELYRQHEKVSDEKSTQSPTNTPKSTTSWIISLTVHPSKKATQKYLNGRGDKNPPRINIDSSHKISLTKKRKNNARQAEESQIESGNLQLEIEYEHMQKIGSSTVEISDTDFFDIDESFLIQSAIFDSQYKILVIEKRDVTNMKGKSHTEIKFSEMSPSQIFQFHQGTSDILRDSIRGIEIENANMKQLLNEFEQAFLATPEFASPLEKNVLATIAMKMKVSSTLLACSTTLVENNINKRMQLVTEAWETSQNLVSFRKKANDLLKQLETNLKNAQLFCDQVLAPFAKYVNNRSELKIRQENLPLRKRTKKVKACWQKKVDNLQLIVKSCKQVTLEKEDLFTSLLQLDLAGTTNEVQDPNLILKSLSVTKEAFKEQVDILKGLYFEKLYNILEHRLDENEHWVLEYASHNEEIEQTLHSISMDIRKLENDLYNIENLG